MPPYLSPPQVPPTPPFPGPDCCRGAAGTGTGLGVGRGVDTSHGVLAKQVSPLPHSVGAPVFPSNEKREIYGQASFLPNCSSRHLVRKTEAARLPRPLLGSDLLLTARTGPLARRHDVDPRPAAEVPPAADRVDGGGEEAREEQGGCPAPSRPLPPPAAATGEIAHRRCLWYR